MNQSEHYQKAEELMAKSMDRTKLMDPSHRVTLGLAALTHAVLATAPTEAYTPPPPQDEELVVGEQILQEREQKWAEEAPLTGDYVRPQE